MQVRSAVQQDGVGTRLERMYQRVLRSGAEELAAAAMAANAGGWAHPPALSLPAAGPGSFTQGHALNSPSRRWKGSLNGAAPEPAG